MNGNVQFIQADIIVGNNSSPRKLHILEEKRKNIPSTPNGQEVDEKKQVGPSTRVKKLNQLPALEKRGGSRARVVTPLLNPTEGDENTTHLSTYSRATRKVPIPDNANQKNLRLPGKSLPRLVGGIRKLEKMPPGKALDPLNELKAQKPKGVQKPIKELSEKTSGSGSTVFQTQFSKTVPGYSDGKTKTNQDTVYVNCSIKGSQNCALFAVFDGHGMQGHKVSQMLKAMLTGTSL